jgi:hypothetical protein
MVLSVLRIFLTSEVLDLVGLKAFACSLLHAGFLLRLLFSPEDGGDIFFQKVG